MKRTARDWHVSYQKDEGFTLRVEEKSLLGEVAARLLLLTDAEWFGRYHNLPWCWINPWEWTWRVGVDSFTLTWTVLDDEGNEIERSKTFERANLGSLWCDVGNRFLSFVDSLKRAREVAVIPLTNDEVKKHLPDAWENFGFLVDPEMPSPWDDDDEEEEVKRDERPEG
jgi:hypothetical protein